MKYTDLRKLVEKSDAPMLLKMLIETYRLLPPGRKNEADVIIQNLLKGMDSKTAADIRMTPEEACQKVWDLIAGIRNGGYYESFGYKDIREQWRYQATGGWKALLAIEENDPLYDQATSLMHDLLVVLEDAPHRGWLQTENAFDSMRVDGMKYYRTYMDRILRKRGFTRDVMFDLLDTGTGELKIGEEYDDLFLSVVLMKIKDEPRARQSVGWTIEWMDERSRKAVKSDMRERERLMHAGIYIASQMFRFDSPEKAWDMYIENSPCMDQEEALYALLFYPTYYADSDEQYDQYWLAVYRRAVETGVKPRKELKDEYKRRLQPDE